jgi:type III secretion protein R
MKTGTGSIRAPRIAGTIRLLAAVIAVAVLSLCAVAGSAWAGEPDFRLPSTPSPLLLVFLLGALSLAPFIIIMLTSFVKISVVLSILRNAIGTQQIPPNQVVTGFAFVLTVFVMLPVARSVYHEAVPAGSRIELPGSGGDRSWYGILEAADRGKEPVREFLARHCHTKDRAVFLDLGRRLDPERATSLQADAFQVLIPSFVTSELKEAFMIGFVIFVPFLVIDMVVANILMALGMMMLSPTTISLPFKLLLFVLTNGWLVIVQSLVLDYAR